MSNPVSHFEDAYWQHSVQKEEFRHRQALAWLVPDASTVLDVGCGDGLFLRLLKQHGIQGSGVDISPVAVQACRESGLEAVVADFAAGELPPFSGRRAVILDVLEHVYDPAPLLRALADRVEELIISVPNFSSLPARLQVLRGRVPENNTPRKGHVYWYTASVLTQVLGKAGWKIEAWAVNPPWGDRPYVGRIMRRLAALYPGLFSLSLLVKARKKSHE